MSVKEKSQTERHVGLSAFALKLIAISSMLTDHIGAILHPEIPLLRYIGRLAFPIFVFMLAEGAIHTHSMKKYFLRMLLFAAVTEIPYNLAFSGKLINLSGRNMMFTLALGLLMIGLTQNSYRFLPADRESRSLAALLLCGTAAELLQTESGFMGILLIYVFYMLHDRPPFKYAIGEIIFILSGGNQWAAGFAFVPMSLYNGRRGYSGRLIQYLFYVFYPAHLLVLYFISRSSFFS